MAKSKETFNKKEKEKKRILKNKEKEEKKEERKANAKKGQSLEDMMAYVDEFGNISSTPPDPRSKRTTVSKEDILVSVPRQAAPDPADLIRTGVVTYFNDAKGYGFIKDSASGDSVFVHINQANEQLKETDKVTFEVEMGPKGLNAVSVKLVTA